MGRSGSRKKSIISWGGQAEEESIIIIIPQGGQLLKESIIPRGGQAVGRVHYSTGRSGCQRCPLFDREVRLLNALLLVVVLRVVFQHVQHLIVVLLRSLFCTCTGTTHCSHSLSTGTWPSDKITSCERSASAREWRIAL